LFNESRHGSTYRRMRDYGGLTERQMYQEANGWVDADGNPTSSRSDGELNDEQRARIHAARVSASEALDTMSKTFIRGGAAIAFAPAPIDIVSVPLVGIGVVADTLADLLNPKPVKMSTDWLVDWAATRTVRLNGPAGAAA